MRILNELITLTWIHRPQYFSSTKVTYGELSIHQAAFSGGSPGSDSSPAQLSRVSWQQVYRCGRGACRPAGQVPHRHRLPFWEVCQFVLVLVLWYFYYLAKMQMWINNWKLLLANIGRRAQPRQRSLLWETGFPSLIWESRLLLPSPNCTAIPVSQMRWKPHPFQVQLWLFLIQTFIRSQA